MRSVKYVQKNLLFFVRDHRIFQVNETHLFSECVLDNGKL